MKIFTPSSAFSDAIYILEPYPYYLNGKLHTGIDIYCRDSHTVQNTEAGEIVRSFHSNDTGIDGIEYQGKESETLFLFKHCKKIVAEKLFLEHGGQGIAKLNNSGILQGYWFGYHLHFQTFLNGSPIDPVEYFLTYSPDMVYFMSEKVKNFYKLKSYFTKMNIGEKPF